REVGQAAEAPGGEARSPLAHGAGVAVEFPRHLVIGGAVAAATAEDDPAAEGLRLRGGMGVGHLLELLLFFAGEADAWRASGHEARSLCKRVLPWDQRSATRSIGPNTPAALETQDSHYRVELVKPATSRSNPSAGTGWGFFCGTFTAGNFGHGGMSPWSAAHCRAVCRNWSRTRMVSGCIRWPPLPGSLRRPATNDETVCSLTERSRLGWHSRSNR